MVLKGVGGQVCGKGTGGLWFKGASFDRFNLDKGNILPRNVCLLAKYPPPPSRAHHAPTLNSPNSAP